MNEFQNSQAATFPVHDGFYIFDRFCQRYWNPKTWNWQLRLTNDCIITNVDAIAHNWHGYMRDEDILVRPYSRVAIAA